MKMMLMVMAATLLLGGCRKRDCAGEFASCVINCEATHGQHSMRPDEEKDRACSAECRAQSANCRP